MNITPSNLQNDAISDIAKWYRSGYNPFFYLGGYAGSGKSSIARLAVEKCGLDPDNHKHVLYGSFTGKAAMVMKRKGLNADTIHHLIYVLKEKKDGKLHFGLDPHSPVRDIKLLVLDECSMISDSIARDLLSYGTKILVLGDPAQLEPVNGTGYFTKGKPHFFLDEIHRQALDNAIIRLSMDVRDGKEIPFGDHGEVRKLSFDDISDDELLDSDQVITGKHVTRHLLNVHMLEAEGFEQGYPLMAGMKVLCLRNYRDVGLLNGSIGRTLDMVDQSGYNTDRRFFTQRVLIEDGPQSEQQTTDPMRMNMGAFEDNWKPRTELEKTNDDNIISESYDHRFANPEKLQYLWDYGYAITTHKSQGSQWSHLILFDDGMLHWKRESRKRWLYTAVTRAAETLTIVV
jgi:exodeoxyribonuclease-5